MHVPTLFVSGWGARRSSEHDCDLQGMSEGRFRD